MEHKTALIERMESRWGVKFGPASIDPSSLAAMEKLVRELRPKNVVEFGSGVSTYFWRELLEEFPEMRVVSVESSGFFLKFLPREIFHPNLQIVHAPLLFWRKGLRFYFTYSHRNVRLALERTPSVDLVLVDGPWGFFGRDAPLFLLEDKLHSGTVVLLDDARREHEQRVAARWRQELGAKSDWLEPASRLLVFRGFSGLSQRKGCPLELLSTLGSAIKKKIVYHAKESEMHFR